MSITTVALIIILLAAAIIYGIFIFNILVALKNTISKNWSNIDVLLKQRYSEIPKLIETCKQYMQYEQETLQKIVMARQMAVDASKMQNLNQLGLAESDLHKSLLKLFALAENYPDLKANHSFMQLQGRISDLESAISDRRELYNDSVNINNIRIQQFPDVIIARLFNFKAASLMKFGEDEIQDVPVQTMFKS